MSSTITTIVRSADLSWEVEKVNRDTSVRTLDINIWQFPDYLFATDKFKKEKNKSDFYAVDIHMIDGEGPLNTNANTYAFLFTWGGQWQNHSVAWGDVPVGPESQRLKPSLEHPLGIIQIFMPNRVTSVTAYAFAKCEPDNKQYESKYEVYAQVPKKYNPNDLIHKRSPTKLFGSWSVNAYVPGSIDDFEDPTQVNLVAKASAIGRQPSTGEEHETKASTEEPTRETEIICPKNESDEHECWQCSEFRTEYNDPPQKLIPGD